MINLVLIGLLPGPADLPRGTYKPIFAILEPEHFFFPETQNYNFPPKNPEKFKPNFFAHKFPHSKFLKKKMPHNTSAAICEMQKDLCIAIKLYAGWIGAIQDKKIELIQNHTFHPYTGFQSLDKYGSGYITVADLTQKLKDYNFPITPTEGQYLVMYKSKCLLYNRRFDAALVRDDVLTYDDFLSLISPNDRKYLADKFSFGVNKYEGVAKVLPEYTYRSLMEVFCMEVEIYREFEKLKHLLIKKHGYCARDAFNEFNKSKVEGRKLSFEDFKDAMTTCNINFLEREYRDLCSELDINSDGLVSKEEFQD